MGFFDNAQEVLDRGVSAAKGAVSVRWAHTAAV